MRISIKEGKKSFFITIPNLLIINSISFRLIKKAPGAHGLDLSSVSHGQIREIRRCIRRMRRIHKRWCFVDAHDSDGSDVKIRL